MGGGGSRSSSKPTLLPGQEQVWRYHGTDTAPMARGQETDLTRLLGQSAMDQAEKQRGLQTQSILEMAGRTGMGAGERASLQRSTNETAMQQALKNIAEMKRQTTLQAMKMIAGLPIAPSQKTKVKRDSPGQVAATDLAGTVAEGYINKKLPLPAVDTPKLKSTK